MPALSARVVSVFFPRPVPGRPVARATSALAGLTLAVLAATASVAGDTEGTTVRPAVSPVASAELAPMVASADPRATEAGLALLRQGGSAVDAAIAAALVLSLVEPQSSGIGGGAFLVHVDRDARRVTTYDGRETAPKKAGPDLFLKSDGTPMAFLDAVVGGRSVGVPGFLRMAENAHKAHGKRPWADLFQPAIALADAGFDISPRLAEAIASDPALATYDTARRYFYRPDGTPKPAGTRVANPEFAATLRAVARGGADAFYRGPIARDIVTAVTGAADNPGAMTLDDLASYTAPERDPLCRAYRVYLVCSMGPPTSGGLAVAQTLGILENFDLASLAPLGPGAVHLMAEAMRLAYADRDAYVGDPDFVAVPTAALMRRDYLRDRAGLIDPARALFRANPGAPKGAGLEPPPMAPAGHRLSTTHLSVLDADGNAISMTVTIEGPFGSRLMTRGFLLNNELTDFSFVPDIGGTPVANRVEGGKRPRSTMSPAVVFNGDGSLRLVIGSPGGPFIAPYVIKTLIGVLDWGLDVQSAIDLPNVANRNGDTEIEDGTRLVDLAPTLESLGHRVTPRRMRSGLHGIEIVTDDTGRRIVRGGADPRGEGTAARP